MYMIHEVCIRMNINIKGTIIVEQTTHVRILE